MLKRRAERFGMPGSSTSTTVVSQPVCIDAQFLWRSQHSVVVDLIDGGSIQKLRKLPQRGPGRGPGQN